MKGVRDYIKCRHIYTTLPVSLFSDLARSAVISAVIGGITAVFSAVIRGITAVISAVIRGTE